MTIAEDASTPAVLHVTIGTTGTGTSASFSPPAGSLVVVLAAVAYNNGTGAISGTPLSCSDSRSNSYTAGVFASMAYHNQAQFTFYYASAPGSITVTVTNSNVTNATMSIAPRVLTGAASSQAGAATATSVLFTNPMAAGSVTTTTAGSWVYVTGGLANNNTQTPLSGTTSIDVWQAPSIRCLESGYQSALTVTPGATTLGWTSGSNETAAWSALEILPATGPPTTTANAGLAAATGAALGAMAAVVAMAGLATGTATAQQPIAGAVNVAPAGLAAGTGTALAPGVTVTAHAGLASATGTAQAPSTSAVPLILGGTSVSTVTNPYGSVSKVT